MCWEYSGKNSANQVQTRGSVPQSFKYWFEVLEIMPEAKKPKPRRVTDMLNEQASELDISYTKDDFEVNPSRLSETGGAPTDQD